MAGLILTYTSKPAPTTLLAPSDAFDERESAMSFEHTFSRAIGPLQSHVFLTLFFASIVFAIVSEFLKYPIQPPLNIT